MAGPAGLRPWLLAGLVLALHALGLEWLARQGDTLAALRQLPPPMYTRLLVPVAPPPVPEPAPATRAPAPAATGMVAVPSRPAASAPPATPQAQGAGEPPEPTATGPAPLAPSMETEAEAETSPPTEVEAGPVLGDAAPHAGVATAESAAATPPAEAAPAQGMEPPVASPEPRQAEAAPAVPAPSGPAPALDTWPADTRLRYRVGGMFRNGPLYGDAQVVWQRTGSRYQVLVDIDVTLWARLVITSQGEVTPQELRPQAYEEVRPGRRRRAATFGADSVQLEGGGVAPRPPGLQDTASQFVDLAHRFATGRETLAVGRSVSFWLGRPGGVDLWTYDIVEKEVLQTPQLGPIEAWRLKPRPITKPRGKVTAEMWFAPSLQYLPVRIKVFTGDEAYVDLLVESVEQR